MGSDEEDRKARRGHDNFLDSIPPTSTVRLKIDFVIDLPRGMPQGRVT